MLQESGPNAQGVQRTLSYLPGLLQHDPSQSTDAAKWLYFHADAQSTRLLTDGSGAVANRWDYDPFGTIRNEDPDDRKTDFGYAGEQRDPETGLLNLRARYYDPGLGRFVKRDELPCATRPGFPQTLNRYSYVLNNPLRYVDPSGYMEAGDCTGSNDGECSEYFDEWDDYHGDGDVDDDGEVDDWDQDGVIEAWESEGGALALGIEPFFDGDGEAGARRSSIVLDGRARSTLSGRLECELICTWTLFGPPRRLLCSWKTTEPDRQPPVGSSPRHSLLCTYLSLRCETAFPGVPYSGARTPEP